MRIPFGTTYCGTTDAVPGLGQVTTQFFHVAYLPLIPLGSYLTSPSRAPLRLPLSLKSIALAYARTALTFATVAGAVLSAFLLRACVQQGQLLPGLPPFLGATLLCGGLLAALFAPALRRASPARQATLRAALGLGPTQPEPAATPQATSPDEESTTPVQTWSTASAPDFVARRRRLLVARPLPTRTRDAVKLACPHCHATGKVPASYAGQRGLCRHCRSPLRVPSPLPRRAPVRGERARRVRAARPHAPRERRETETWSRAPLRASA